MPERVIYNHLHQLLLNQEIFHPKQFGFQKDHSTDHALIQLVDQIHEVFEKNRYTLGVSIDLSKAFDTRVLWYTIRENNLEWFQNYLKNRIQFIQMNNHKKTRIQTAKFFAVFILYVNDLKSVSDLVEPIMFADDTNLFYSSGDIKNLFAIVNNELKNINKWFISK